MSSLPSERRRMVRVPCASAVVIARKGGGEVLGVVVNASLAGVMIRVAPPMDYEPGERVSVAIDAHDGQLDAEVVSVWEDKLSMRFLQPVARLRVDTEDSRITIEERPAD